MRAYVITEGGADFATPVWHRVASEYPSQTNSIQSRYYPFSEDLSLGGSCHYLWPEHNNNLLTAL